MHRQNQLIIRSRRHVPTTLLRALWNDAAGSTYLQTCRTPPTAGAAFRLNHSIASAGLVRWRQETIDKPKRFMSDNLLGHSPMATNMPPGSQLGPMPTDKEANGLGGVFAQASTKRDKLNELRLELPQGASTLEEAATPDEALDLNLADGLCLIAQFVDQAWDQQGQNLMSNGLLRFLQTSQESRNKRKLTLELTKDEYEAHITEALRLVDVAMDEFVRKQGAAVNSTGGDKKDASRDNPAALAFVRDFAELPEPDVQSSDKGAKLPEPARSDLNAIHSPFEMTLTWHRLQLIHSCLSMLLEDDDGWDMLTKISDGDMDRAATRGESQEATMTVHLERLNALIRSFAKGGCTDRIQALWELLDRDQDGLIDQDEMNQVAKWVVKPVSHSTGILLQQAIEVHPVRSATLPIPPTAGNPWTMMDEGITKRGWRQRRKEKKIAKGLQKLFETTISSHFDMEVELNHRLRCVFAWTEKAHQDNKLKSVLVDDGKIVGRKRYVELQPKISYEEFISTQKIHLSQLDRVGAEILTAFHDDILVVQGKGRQSKELKIQVFAFLSAMAVLDVILHNM